MTPEQKRLEESRAAKVHWQRWGPYLSERQWGTVREDYSPYGIAWEDFSLPLGTAFEKIVQTRKFL